MTQLRNVGLQRALAAYFTLSAADADLTDQLVARRYSMLRMGLAPCSPFTVTQDLMVEAAKLARKYEGVRLHTHMAENQARQQTQKP